MKVRPRIAVIDDILDRANERCAAIERFLGVSRVHVDVFGSADELIEAVDRRDQFYDVIVTDVFMPPRSGGRSRPEAGAVRITEWLARKRHAGSEDFARTQLRWVSRHSDVSPFVHEHVTRDRASWLAYITHHEKSSFYEADFLPMVMRAIDLACPRFGDTAVCPEPASRAMRNLLDECRSLARRDVPVLVTGETGVGKSWLVERIHAWSPRSGGRLVEFNCAAFPETLFEGELFGHARGAFTGATRDRQGLVGEADGGTLFLDEVGDLPLPLQVKLLTVIEKREYRRLGDSAPRVSDFRLVCATHRDLDALVREGRFREDLRYRIAVADLHVPPLRERSEDLPGLVVASIEDIAARLRVRPLGLSSDAMVKLSAHAWPGNVRELRNVLERALALASEDAVQLEASAFAIPSRGAVARPRTREDDKDHEILRLGEACGFNQARVAAERGVSRAAVHKRLKERPALKAQWDERKARYDEIHDRLGPPPPAAAQRPVGFDREDDF